MILNKWFSIKETKENFLDYNFNIREDSNTDISLPFYGSGKNVSHLYDNLYFDKTNGSVISLNGTQTGTGSHATTVSLTNIYIIPRKTSDNTITITTYPYKDATTQIAPIVDMEILYKTYNCKDVDFTSNQATPSVSYNYQYFY